MKAKVGKYKVDKELLDAYIRLAVENHFAEPGMSIFVYSRRMMDLHYQLRKSVGLEGMWCNPPDEFDSALSKMWYDAAQADKRTIERRRLFRAQMKEGERKGE